MTLLDGPESERRSVTFFVEGEPASQAGMREVPLRRGDGSLVYGKNGQPQTRLITVGSKNLKQWRALVSKHAAAAAAAVGQIPAPVEVRVVYTFPMPAARSKQDRITGRIFRVVKPDGDKMQRAIWDSLKTGGLIEDDARVAKWSGVKYETVDGPHGVRITVREARMTT